MIVAVPALQHSAMLWAHRLLTDRREPVLTHSFFNFAVAFARRQLDLEPVRFALARELFGTFTLNAVF